MGNMIDIIDEYVTEMENDKESLAEKRLAICKECPLYLEGRLGPICNPNLYINKDGEVSTKMKNGYKRGCSCNLKRKSVLPHAKCIVNK